MNSVFICFLYTFRRCFLAILKNKLLENLISSESQIELNSNSFYIHLNWTEPNHNKFKSKCNVFELISIRNSIHVSSNFRIEFGISIQLNSIREPLKMLWKMHRQVKKWNMSNDYNENEICIFLSSQFFLQIPPKHALYRLWNSLEIVKFTLHGLERAGNLM